MRARHEGKKWVVREKRHVFGRHRTRKGALRQEGAIHLHERQSKSKPLFGGGFGVFGAPKRKRRRRGKKKGKR